MCLIIDANLASTVFDAPTREDFVPITDWLTSNKKDGKLVVGGQLATELDKVNSARRFVRVLQQAGRARLIPDDAATDEAKRIGGKCVSNDAHVIALARLSGARVLCSHDKALQQDFGDLKLISKPKGRVYQRREHASLLREYGHTSACRKILSR
jgi:hypothetical protein